MEKRKYKVCEGKLIFRRFKKLPNGTSLDSYKYGLKGWPMCIALTQNTETDIVTVPKA